MRWWQSLAAGNQGLDLRVCQLRSPDLGHRRNHHASLQAAADCLVLGGLSDGYPLQRHLGAATAASARFRLLQDGVADLRQACAAACSLRAGARWPAWSRWMKPKSHAAAKTIRSRAVAGAAIRAKCWSSALSRSKTAALAPAASASARSLITRLPASTPSSPTTSPPAPPP